MIQTARTYANAAIGSDENVLQDIHLASKNIAVYQRNVESLSKELELSQIAAQPIECRASGTVAEILAILNDYFGTHLSECPLLLNDISNYLRLFKKTTESSFFRLLLTVVSTNMCRKFHTDVNDLRLLCTYIGPGTLWLPDETVNFKALQRRGEYQEIVGDQGQIQQVRTGDVVILKGALYPDANPVLHRSPAIEKHGEKRLLLRIDTNEFLNF